MSHKRSGTNPGFTKGDRVIVLPAAKNPTSFMRACRGWVGTVTGVYDTQNSCSIGVKFDNGQHHPFVLIYPKNLRHAQAQQSQPQSQEA